MSCGACTMKFSFLGDDTFGISKMLPDNFFPIEVCNNSKTRNYIKSKRVDNKCTSTMLKGKARNYFLLKLWAVL